MAGLDPETLEQAWREVEANWDDDQQHRRFLELCRIAGDLKGAGQRYRQVREGDPGRSAMAAAQIDRLLNLALQDMQALRTRSKPRSRVWLLLTVAATSALLLHLVRTLLLPK